MHKQKSVKTLLRLLTLLIVSSRAYGISEGWAQTEVPQPVLSEVAAQQANGKSVIAKRLLRQLETAAYGLKDDGAKAYGLVAIADSYLAFADEAPAVAHLSQALNLVDTIPDQSIKPAVLTGVVSTTIRLSDEAVVAELLTQVLAEVDEIQDDDSTKSLIFNEVAWRLSNLSNQTIANNLLNQAGTIANNSISANESKAVVLLSLVDAYIKFTDQATVNDLLTRTLNIISATENEAIKTSNLNWLIRLAQQTFEDNIDPVLLQQIMSVIDSMQNAENQARALAYTSVLIT